MAIGKVAKNCAFLHKKSGGNSYFLTRHTAAVPPQSRFARLKIQEFKFTFGHLLRRRILTLKTLLFYSYYVDVVAFDDNFRIFVRECQDFLRAAAAMAHTEPRTRSQ